MGDFTPAPVCVFRLAVGTRVWGGVVDVPQSGLPSFCSNQTLGVDLLSPDGRLGDNTSKWMAAPVPS